MPRAVPYSFAGSLRGARLVLVPAGLILFLPATVAGILCGNAGSCGLSALGSGICVRGRGSSGSRTSATGSES